VSVQIVPIAERHIEGFHKAIDIVARERKYLAFVQAPPISSTRRFVLANIAAGHPQFVALDGDEVVGWCDILPKALEGFTHCAELGIGVLPSHRGRGIGKRLMQETLTLAKKQNLERVELQVYASNRAAVSLYEAFGFEVEGIKKRARKIDGVYDDIVMMALEL